MRTIKYILLGMSVCCMLIGGYAQNSNKTQKERKVGNGWTSIGPSNISGRTLTLCIDKDNSQVLYVGASGSGLWKSTNGGASWIRNTSYDGSAAVSAIVQDNTGALYVGTGDGFANLSSGPGVSDAYNTYGIKGDGIYKSIDGGASFSLLQATEDWEEINDMAFDFNTNKLYVATNGGLMVSADGGNSFQLAHAGVTFKCVEVHIVGDIIVYTNMGANANAYVSVNGGTSFSSLCGTDKLPSNAGRISLAVSSTASNIMYALVANAKGKYIGAYQSRNTGATWRTIAPTSGMTDLIGGEVGLACNKIIVDQEDSSKVFLGGSVFYRGAEYDTEHDFNWTAINSVTNIYNITAKGQNIYICTSSGIMKSTNGGTKFVASNNNFSSMQSYTLAVANDGRFLSGIRDGGLAYISNPNNTSKRATIISNGAGDGGNAIFSFIKPETMFYTGYYGYCYRRASENSDAQTPAEWYGNNTENTIIKEKNTSYTRWHPTQNNMSLNYSSARVNPLAIWESYNDINSIDSVEYIVDNDYVTGDVICVKSARNNYPIYYTYNGTDSLHRNADTLKVQDIVTSRLFLGGGGHRYPSGLPCGAPVYLTTTGLDYFNLPYWMCVFRTKDSTEQVMDLKVSEDGDHLFVLARKFRSGIGYEYSIYRVSGFDTHRTREEMEVYPYGDPNKGFADDNPYRQLEDNVLIENVSGVDILSITLDPQDNNNLIYTTNGNGLAFDRVVVITDALTATNGNATVKPKEGTGIPENLAVYTAIVEMNHANLAYIGTEAGVYISENFTSDTPTWTLYNNGITIKVPVFKLFQQTKNWPKTQSVSYSADGTATYIDFPGVSNYGSIYAATHGLGVFIDSTYFDAIADRKIDHSSQQMAQNIKVYPNPTNNTATLAFELKEKTNLTINVTDITGRIIKSEYKNNLTEGYYQENIDCSNLSEGIYFVTINMNNKVYTKKLVVNK